MRRQVWIWLALLACLAIAVKGRHFASMDLTVAQWMAAVRSPALDHVARAVTFFGSSPWVIGVMAVMSLSWWRRPSLLAVFWGTWLAGFTVQILLRIWVAQWRPDIAAAPVAADAFTRFDLAGFTSGHTFRSAFLFGWWAGWLKRRDVVWAGWACAGCLAFIGLVGGTRLYLNRHWLTDVAGAWLLALVVFAAAGERLYAGLGRTPERAGAAP